MVRHGDKWRLDGGWYPLPGYKVTFPFLGSRCPWEMLVRAFQALEGKGHVTQWCAPGLRARRVVWIPNPLDWVARVGRSNLWATIPLQETAQTNAQGA